MAIPFAHAMQSLQADRMQPTLVGVTVTTVLLTLWALWFFLAPITLYANGQVVGVTRDGTLLAQFSAADAARVARGQPVRILPPAVADQQPAAFTGIVARITQQGADGAIQVAITLAQPGAATQLVGNAAAQQSVVEVAVAHVSPATLVARAAGFVNEHEPS